MWLRASNGREALEVLAKENVDVIVSDVMMPEMDGLEVLRRTRENQYCHSCDASQQPNPKIEDRVAGLNAGADDYLPKPFAASEFICQGKGTWQKKCELYRESFKSGKYNPGL